MTAPEPARGAVAENPLCHLRTRMRRPDVAPELFYPLDVATWSAGRLRLDRAGRQVTRSQVSGVRFHAADPEGEDLGPERLTQRDAVRLVSTLRTLRQEPGCDGLVLTRRALPTRRPRGEDGRRVKFGLDDLGARGEDDTEAARLGHLAMKRAIRRSGFRILAPTRFDPRDGLAGLEAWAGGLRLGHRRRPPWWLLLLPLLFFFRDCTPTTDLFGLPVHDESLLIVLDKSSSMGEHFPAVRSEVRELLDAWLEAGGDRYAEIIAYDSTARMALGGLKPLTAKTRDQLLAFVDQLEAGGGTNLKSGLEAAGQAVRAHARPTTLFMLTDARDSSIAELNANFPPVLESFGGHRATGHALTPRLFSGPGGAPNSDEERRLAELAERLGGRFGPEETQP